MQRLPNLVTKTGSISLPLSGRTAGRLVAALIAGAELHCDRQIVGEALARDAAFTLWASCRAARRRAGDFRTLDELGGWLSTAAIDELSAPDECVGGAVDANWVSNGTLTTPPGNDGGHGPQRGSRREKATAGVAAPNPAPRATAATLQQANGPSAPSPGIAVRACATENWADLAARSLGVARLAHRLAGREQLDGKRAYLLGLLHAARRWLLVDGSTQWESGLSELLPDWLQVDLAAIDAAHSGDCSSVPGCVARALRMTGSAADVAWQWECLDFHFQAHQARIAAARREWGEPSQDELLGPLVTKLRRLKRLSEQFERTLETEKLDSLKELAYGAGHEINNPLANISARAQTLLPAERDPDRRRMLAAIHTQALRAHEMIADMMLFARPPEPKRASIDLVSLVRQLAAELAPQAATGNCELALEMPERPVVISADKTQIAVALRALCVNALEALVTGGNIVIKLAESLPVRDAVQITVSDDGPGISPEVRRHIFDPFFSGREAGRGLGFGLSKCWRIVGLHGGQIDVNSTPGSGARFTITLPVGETSSL